MSIAEPSGDCLHHRLSSKRKLDDYGSTDDDFSSDLVSVRMRKGDPFSPATATAVVDSVSASSDHSSSSPTSDPLASRVSDARSLSESPADFKPSVFRLQFFVRTMCGGKTLVVHANSDDTVKSVHEYIHASTGIPVSEQRLIYRGKQLQWEQSLAECSVQNDAGLQLVGRMRSTGHPQAWQVINDMIFAICGLCRGDRLPSTRIVRNRLMEFLNMTPKSDTESAAEHLQILVSSCAPSALVMLYMSSNKGNKECAEESIKHFLSSTRNSLPKSIHNQCAPIVLDFCKLLSGAGKEDPLYCYCRSTLGSLVEAIGIARGSKYFENPKASIAIEEILPFVRELAGRLSRDLVSISELPTSGGPSKTDVQDFTSFVNPLRMVIMDQVEFQGSILMPIPDGVSNHLCYAKEIKFLYSIFTDLHEKMFRSLEKLEESLNVKGAGEGEVTFPGCSQYLAILKELNSISKIYDGAEERFWEMLSLRKLSLCPLIIKYAKRSDDPCWLLEHKNVINFESRRHLAMMMFPEVKEEYEELHEMLIDRSQLLAESFEYIARVDAEALHAGLFMEFKNEEATGPGVLREWFFLVCQAIFNPQNALFVPCPNDRRRFFPNPASKVDPLHLEYFAFSGRVIALALMHKVQVGVVFDRIFFLQLAGKNVSLEDIRDADPYLYNSCKKLLEMDADFMDSDALALTFVTEVEELGSRRVVELCYGGRSITVNSTNREEYVKLLIHNRFVLSISEQITHFAQGFTDILCSSRLHTSFFQSLELEDLDWMLHGSESALCVEDWKAHTDYNGYKETDSQIIWFWKIVAQMSEEQKQILLCFWTSVKYLPVEGFRGLASRLYIYKSTDAHDRLPTSHTCFYRLCIPKYSSMSVMEDRLRIITQEHVGCSFGTW